MGSNDSPAVLVANWIRSVPSPDNLPTTILGIMKYTPCACVGPIGDCPCVRLEKGLKVEITETQISADLFAMLPDADKVTINNLKHKALGIYMGRRKSDRDN